MSETRRRGNQSGQLIFGLILIVVGILFALDTFGIWYFDSFFSLWPLILVGIGVGKIWGSQDLEEKKSGVWLLVIGLWLLISNLGLFGFGWGDSWPLLLIGIGGVLIWQALAGTEDRSWESGNGS